MLSVPIQKDVGEYQPKIIGKMTARTLACVVGALGLSVGAGCYLYFVIGVDPGDWMIVIYAASLPFWAAGFIRPHGMKFEQFAAAWLNHRLSSNKLFYTPTLYDMAEEKHKEKKGGVYGREYRKLLRRRGIEAYSPKSGKVG